MSIVWWVLGVLAVALLGAIVELAVKDFTRHSFPSFASWWGSIGGELVRVTLGAITVVGIAAALLLMASLESETGIRVVLCSFAALALLVTAREVHNFRQHPRGTRR